MKKIKNIIFDLGGVIYDIRYENVAEAFVSHGVTNLSDIYSRTSQTHEMDLFEMGLMSVEEMREGIKQLADAPLTDQDVDDIYNAILVDMPAMRVALLLALREKYKVFLFSNTNQINYEYFTKYTKDKFGFDVFEKCFDAAYFSHLMHKRKPAADGFLQILEEQHLDPEETLFIDDNEPNLAGAREAGMRGYWLHDKDILDLFDDRFDPIPELEG